MSLFKRRRRLIRFIRLYPVIALLVLTLAYLFGGFEERVDPVIPRTIIISSLYLFGGVVPLFVIISFLIIGAQGDREKKINQKISLPLGDLFELPKEAMAGYKLALLTGASPSLTGLTGDTYKSDGVSVCNLNSQHTPPVPDCECGFYAYQDLDEAIFELSINPGAFLIYVDLYGIGLGYQRGYRAESQVVRNLKIPSRCMRCKILRPQLFVRSFKLGFDDSSWWQWQVRCAVCSSTFKADDKLSFTQMAKQLKLVIN